MGVKQQQLGFSGWERSQVRKQTRKEKFLWEMETVLPFSALVKLMEPFYPQVGPSRGKAALWVGDHATDSPDAELVVPEGRSHGRRPD